MTGSPLPPSPGATSHDPGASVAALGRLCKRVTLAVIVGSAAALGLLWLLGYVKFD